MKIALSSCSWLVALPLTFAPQLAAADQCQWVNEPAAQTAVKILREHPEVRLYCAPCRDRTPTPVHVVKAEVQQAGMGGQGQPFKTVKITDPSGKITEIDLAYTYVQLDAQSPVYTNLAKLASCPASDVPETIGPSAAPPPPPDATATPAAAAGHVVDMPKYTVRRNK